MRFNGFDEKGGLINYKPLSPIRPVTKGRYTGGIKRGLPNKTRKPAGFEKFQKKLPEPPKSGSVICTRLHELGLLDAEVYKLDSEYGQYLLANDSMVIAGYHAWGIPMTRAMHGKNKRSRLLIKIVRVFTLPVANEMARRISGEKGGVFIGLTVDTMLSVCRVLGKRIGNGRNKRSSASFQ